MSDGQSAFAEPMSMQEALNAFDSQLKAKESVPEETAQKPEQEVEAEEIQAEADVATDETEETPDVDEPTDEGSEQILNVEEYGDVLIDMDGEPTTLKDLIQGTLKQADYTRKTMALSSERKAMEAEFAEERKALDARSQQLEQMAAAFEEQEPDWEKLAEEDPLAYPVEKARWDKRQAERKAQQEQAEASAQKQRQEFMGMTVEKALEVFPDWGEKGNFEKGVSARKDAALAAGFTVQEYESTPDYRIAVLLEKAARYDAMTSEKEKKRVAADKKIAKAPKVMKPGASRGDTDPATERRAAIQKRFSKPISSKDIKTLIGRR